MAKKKTRSDVSRSRKVAGVQLDFVPKNEQGVVFLFSQLARKRFGLLVREIRASYPDCIAEDCDGERVRIGFEYESKNFNNRKHDAKKCDWIVCWRHNWPKCPDRLQVVELRKEFGLGLNVWLVPIKGPEREKISKYKKKTPTPWSAPPGAAQGDLILVYRTDPDKFIQDIFITASPVTREKKDREPGKKDYMAKLERVVALRTPIYLDELRSHPILKTAGFVRADMRDRYRLSVHWPELFKMIVERNPAARGKLSKYGPDRL